MKAKDNELDFLLKRYNFLVNKFQNSSKLKMQKIEIWNLESEIEFCHEMMGKLYFNTDLESEYIKDVKNKINYYRNNQIELGYDD